MVSVYRKKCLSVRTNLCDPVFLYLVAGTDCCPADAVLSQVLSTPLLSGAVKYSRLIWRVSCSQPSGVAPRHLLPFVGLVLESKIMGVGWKESFIFAW